MNMYLTKHVLFGFYVFIDTMYANKLQIRTHGIWVVNSVFHD